MPEHHIAGLVDMLVEVQCPACFAQELRELALTVLDRRATQVLAVEFKQVEGEQHGLSFDRPVVTQPVKNRDAVLAADHASPSIRQERQESAATAAAIAG